MLFQCFGGSLFAGVYHPVVDLCTALGSTRVLSHVERIVQLDCKILKYQNHIAGSAGPRFTKSGVSV